MAPATPFIVTSLNWASIAVAKTVPKTTFSGRFSEATDIAAPKLTDYCGISIHHTSSIRAVSVFFDDDPTPWPLVGRTMIAREFSRVRVEPLYDANPLTGIVYPANAGTLAGTNINPQVVRFVLWRQTPPHHSDWNPDYWKQVAQVDIVATGAIAANTPIFHFHNPGARIVKVFASNCNNANAGPLSLNYFRMSPIYNNQAFPTTFGREEVSATNIAPSMAQNLVAAADGNAWSLSWYDTTPSIESAIALATPTVAGDRIRLAAYACFVEQL